MATHSSILPWRTHGKKSLVGYSTQGCKESDMTEAAQETCTHAPNLNFPGGSEQRIHLPSRRCRFNSWVRKIPWRGERLPTPGFWLGELHGLYRPWGCKELDMTEQHSLSILCQHQSSYWGMQVNKPGKSPGSPVASVLVVGIMLPLRQIQTGRSITKS